MKLTLNMERLIALAICAFMFGCASPSSTKPEAFDQARQEMTQATQDRKAPVPRTESLIPPLSVEMPKNGDEQRFDLSVVNAPAVQVFMALVTGTRYNMLVAPEVSGTITIKLRDVTVKEALESIRELYGYEFTIKGTRISIQPNTLQTRVFQLNYLASRRQGTTELRVTSSAITGSGAGAGATTTPGGTATPLPAGTTGASPTSGLMGNLTSRVQTTSDNDFWTGLTTALSAIIGNQDGRSVVVSPQSGVIVVRAFPRDIRAVETYLKATQTVIERQVMLEAKIIEVSLSKEFQSGINWAGLDRLGRVRWSRNANTAEIVAPGSSYSGSLATSTIAGIDAAAGTTPSAFSTVTGTAGLLSALPVKALGAGGVLGLAFQTGSFVALMNFLETQGSVSVLSSPRIATLNNQKAVLKVGTDELFVTNLTTTTTSTTTGSISTPSVTLQPYFSGISLDVTPQVDEDNNIILHIHPAVSTVTEKQKVIDLGTQLGQYKLPLASSKTNETDTVVRVQDGNIVAIGGLMRHEQYADSDGLPGVKDIPVAGAAFGNKSNIQSKRELVILLKPTVIHDDRSWVKDLEQTGERIRALDPRQLAKEE